MRSRLCFGPSHDHIGGNEEEHENSAEEPTKTLLIVVVFIVDVIVGVLFLGLDFEAETECWQFIDDSDDSDNTNNGNKRNGTGNRRTEIMLNDGGVEME